MNIDENLASEFDDEVQEAGIPTSDFSFNFAYAFTFFSLLFHLKM